MQGKLIIGCGYLGCRVAQRWVERSETVFAVSRSTERCAELASLGMTPLVGDVLVPESLPDFPQVGTVLYAIAPDRAAGATPRDVYVRGLQNMLPRLAGKFERLIYISSTSVYGQNAGEWVDESSLCAPESENGRVVLEAEQILRAAIPEANVLRLAGIYGPGRLIARVESLRSGAPISGNPAAWLNLIHVDDAVAAVLACEERGAPGETYLVCDDRPIPRREYYETLAQLVNAPAPKFVEAAAENTGRAMNKRCSNRRMREELSVTLTFPTIAEGLPHAT
jgi:nucleoside-diphosphate-sugar epimerase